MDLEKWASGLQQEVYREWGSKYSSWKPGFKVFYAPVSLQPKLMIISLQPGGGEEHFLREDKFRFESGDFSVQKENSYTTTNNAMARAVRSLFAENLELLEKSVIFPLIFFRAKSYALWNQAPQRKEMELFSIEKVKEIIVTIKPERILILGIATYDKLKNFLPVANEKILYRRGGSEAGTRIVIGSDVGGIKTTVVIHPSGARLSVSDRKEVVKILNLRS